MTSQAGRLANHAARAADLRVLFGIDPVQPIVGIKNANAELVEWVVHDICHALTLGFRTFVTNLSEAVSMMHDRLTIQTQDSLEIDTAWLTYTALRSLRLVTSMDRPRIASACSSNLSDDSHGRVHYVLDQFDIRNDQATANTALHDHLAIINDLFRKPLARVAELYVHDVQTGVPGRPSERYAGL